MNPPIPIPILEDLRCVHCKKFVTCGPVFLTPNNGILCGRCRRFAKDNYRDYQFEALASQYRYPCHYWPKHCNKQLKWNEAHDHESNCLFQSGCNVLCSRPGTFFKSDRKLPNIEEISYEHVTNEVLDKLKCISCESYLSNSPVLLGFDGNSICHRCSHSNGIPKHAIRNIAYEIIATSFIFPCIYRFRGCPMWMRFGREMWGHENECPYGQITRKLSKKPSKLGPNEKAHGVITTHSGHYWGTITPNSVPAPWAPPNYNNNNNDNNVTQELAQVIKNKHRDEEDPDDMDEVMSRASTLESFADNNSKYDNISRDNVSQDNISQDISRDNSSRYSSRQHDSITNPYDRYKPSSSVSNLSISSREEIDFISPFPQEVAPVRRPAGFNKISYNGYYQENPQYVQHPEVNLSRSNSYNYTQNQMQPKRLESFRVGNKSIIEELKLRNNFKKNVSNPYDDCNSLQEIVQKHDEAFK